MKNLSNLFKAVTALIYVVPGVGFFRKFPFPVNVSGTLVLVVCEVIAAILILMQFINKEDILKLSKKQMKSKTTRRVVLAAVLFLGVSFFYSVYTSRANSGEDVLLPITCNEPLCTDYVDAKEGNETVAEFLGTDKLLQRIETGHKSEILVSQTIYYILVVGLFNMLIVIFISLGFYYEKSAPQQGDEKEDN